MIRQKRERKMDNNDKSFYTMVAFGLLLTHRYFQEIVPSTGADLGVLMLHQGSEYDESTGTITLQPKRARIARVPRLVRDATGAVRPMSRQSRLKPGSLIKFGHQPHGFDLSNLRPVGSPLATPLPVLDASAYADAKAVHGLTRKGDAMERFQAARSGAQKEETTEVVADSFLEIETGVWAYRGEDGTWTVADAAARWEPVVGLPNMEEAKAAAQLQLEQISSN